MKLAIMQPYLFPYIGYFQLINAVDVFVVYDDVNYIKKGWINRNNLLVNKQKKLLTISLLSASQNKLINEITISDSFEKLRKTIEFNYSKAPFYPQVYDLLNQILNYDDRNLSSFIVYSLKKISDYLNIDTKIILSSNLKKDNKLRGEQKIMAICKELQADTYINPIGGVELYHKEFFKENKIDLFFLKSQSRPYSQFSLQFEPSLSILDVLMHNSPSEINGMLSDYELI